ncbi:hypothetical protein HBA92_21405 [Ochrobactrum sp. MR28]|nr:hypothetical protein [Ochrobactrum sp. MR28]MBX8818834.1 hypothetical protein [Ochrobactrum sp. MR31]
MKFNLQSTITILGLLFGFIFQAVLMYLTWLVVTKYGFQEMSIAINDYRLEIPVIFWFAALFALIFTNYLLLNYVMKRKNDADEAQRLEISSIDLLEKRFENRINNLAKNISSKKLLDGTLSREIINEKFGDDLVTSVDEALQQRVGQVSKIIRSQNRLNEVTDDLKIRLEGPGGRAEKQANAARRLAYFMALLGVIVAVARIYYLKDQPVLETISKLADGRSIWPFIIAHSAPWIGLIILIEFAALMFVRFSTQANLQQRYFTESYTELKDRHAALSTIIEYGTPEQIITSARAMIVYGQRQMAESNDAETISASSNLVQSLTGLIKETVSKAGTK